ncbi:MAG TPA: hypothetical protein VGC72_03970 [Candidatus Elarobacter sp.]
MRNRIAAIFVIALLLAARAAGAQPVETPSPQPAPASSPPLPPAGAIPANISLDVTGSPADAAFLDKQIRNALDREIRPTLQAGAGISYGPIVPWPLAPLTQDSRTAVNVTVRIAGDTASLPVTAVTTVTVNNVAVMQAPQVVLFLSDDPEYFLSEGLAFRGTVTPNKPSRLYYYHSDIGLPRDLDVVLTSTVPSRVHLIQSESGPDLDVMAVGHSVTRDLLRFQQAGVGTIVNVVPSRPYVLRHVLMLQAEAVAGAVDLHVLNGGAVTVSVVGTPAGGRPETYLGGPRMPFDGHQRHGTFDLDGFGALAATYTIGAESPAAVTYGGRSITARNLDPSDAGRDLGDYGVVHRITFTLINPTDDPHPIYLYEKPLGGPVRGTFIIDGQLKELGCARLPQPYWITTYQLLPHSTGATTTVTMTDGGSFYPVEFGVTETQPLPYTPPVGSPDGCSPNATRSAQPARSAR